MLAAPGVRNYLIKAIERDRKVKEEIKKNYVPVPPVLTKEDLIQTTPANQNRINLLKSRIELDKRAQVARNQIETERRQNGIIVSSQNSNMGLNIQKLANSAQINDLIKDTSISYEPTLKQIVLSQPNFESARNMVEAISRYQRDNLNLGQILERIDPKGQFKPIDVNKQAEKAIDQEIQKTNATLGDLLTTANHQQKTLEALIRVSGKNTSGIITEVQDLGKGIKSLETTMVQNKDAILVAQSDNTQKVVDALKNDVNVSVQEVKGAIQNQNVKNLLEEIIKHQEKLEAEITKGEIKSGASDLSGKKGKEKAITEEQQETSTTSSVPVQTQTKKIDEVFLTSILNLSPKKVPNRTTVSKASNFRLGGIEGPKLNIDRLKQDGIIEIEGMKDTFNATPGLLQLLFLSDPQPGNITKSDAEIYKDIIYKIPDAKRYFNSTNKSRMVDAILNQEPIRVRRDITVEGPRRSVPPDKEDSAVGSNVSGSGLKSGASNPSGKKGLIKARGIPERDKTIHRLELIMGSLHAGNKNQELANEAVEILKHLLETNQITPSMFKKYLSEI